MRHPAAGQDSAARAARELRATVGRLGRRLREPDDAAGLTPSQTSVLSRLGTDGSSSAGDLATAERVRQQSVSATLEVLAEHGLITRRPDPDDGRRMLVSLSAAGRALFVGRGVVGEDWLTRALREQFTQAERLTVIEAMVLLDRLSRP